MEKFDSLVSALPRLSSQVTSGAFCSVSCHRWRTNPLTPAVAKFSKQNTVPRPVFHLVLWQAHGFIRSIEQVMALDFLAPVFGQVAHGTTRPLQRV